MLNTAVRMGYRAIVMTTAVLGCALPAAAQVPESPEQQGRALLEQHKDAVVTVRVVVSTRMSMRGAPAREDESVVEATGTVIQPDGLTVMALSSTDPSGIMQRMMPANLAGQMQMDNEVKDVEILQPDGSEIPARIILRDVDLDLAYLRPLERPEAPMPFIDFANTGEPLVLDRVVTINRLGRVAGRVHSASFESIDAIVEKPRRFYVPGNDPTNTGQGSPVLTLDGGVVGVLVIRAVQSSSGGGGGFFGGQDNFQAIILPASEVTNGAEQAPPWDDDAGEETEADSADTSETPEQ